MKRTKRCLSLLLALVLVLGIFTMVPMTASAANYEYAMFPMTYLNISQGVNGSFSHQGTNAIDITGKDSGIDTAYAPFTGVVKRIYQGYVVWLESSNPVIFADGTVDYMTIMVMHDNDTSDLYVGKTVKQGERFFEEGTTGYATGNHIHLECAKGKFQGNGWYQNSQGQWMIYNSIVPYNALHISSSTIVKNGYGYNWKYATHTHSYDTYVYYWAEHPHYKCYKCSCGEVKENRDEPTYIDSCAQCRVGKTTVRSDKDVYYTGERVVLTWDEAPNATHYNFYIMKKDSSGEYKERIDWITLLEQTEYYIDGLSDGEYMIELYSYDKNHWESDGSDWCHERADLIYFSVKEYENDSYPGVPSVKVRAGTDAEYTQFYWDVTKNTDEYELKIHDSVSGERVSYHTGITTFNKQVKLPAGDYVVYPVSIKNSLRDTDRWWTSGAAVTFTVTEGEFKPSVETVVEGKRYELYNITMPWTEAKAKCEELGGHLVTITSAEEAEIVNALVAKGDRTTYWLGLSDMGTEGKWENVTGEDISYSNWDADEPNNYDGAEDCALIIRDSFYWNDVTNEYASYSIGFVCEYENNIEKMDFTLSEGENAIPVSWTEIPDAVKYEFAAVNSKGEVDTVTSNGISIKWVPDDDWCYENVRISVKAYDSSGNLVGKSDEKVYSIADAHGDWWGDYGDADFDGIVTIKDATAIQKHVAGMLDFAEAAKASADVAYDGAVSIKDATAIQKFIAGIETDSRVGEYFFWSSTLYSPIKVNKYESDWVPASQVPADAEITERKYTYTLTETTSSKESSISGWTQVGSSWQQVNSGSWFHTTYPAGFGGTKNYSTSALTEYEKSTEKREVSASSVYSYIYWHWCRGNDSVGPIDRKIEYTKTGQFGTFDAFESAVDKSYDSVAEAYYYPNSSCCGDTYWWFKFPIYKQTYTDYQKLFSYEKKTEMESEDKPTGSGVSNVTEWVKYMCYE